MKLEMDPSESLRLRFALVSEAPRAHPRRNDEVQGCVRKGNGGLETGRRACQHGSRLWTGCSAFWLDEECGFQGRLYTP
jgi:hypothetical protein